MTRLKDAEGIGGVGDHLPAKPHDDPFGSRLDPWRPRVVPHRFLAGLGFDGLGTPEEAGETVSRSHVSMVTFPYRYKEQRMYR